MSLDTLYLVHHSHTDIGFTLDQPILWEMERRFIDMAIDCAERDAGHDDDHAFKWTVETFGPLLHWLRFASDKQVARFQRLAKLGRIEVTAQWLNLTPLLDTADLVEVIQPVARLRRDYGLDITHHMSADVNGHNWGLTDTLLDAGVATLSMALNEHFGGTPLTRPLLFNWQTPSGRRLPVLNGWHYSTGNWVGIPDDLDKFASFVPKIEAKLAAAGWTLPGALLQVTGQGGDNRGPDTAFRDFVAAWNARGQAPRIRCATFREFWTAMAPHLAALPVHRGDWTDYWNFGAISSAREVAVTRHSRARLHTADTLHALLQPLGFAAASPSAASEPPGRDPAVLLATAAGQRAAAWQALHLFGEHTWGWFGHVGDPEHEDAAAQWNHKAQPAYLARSLSRLLARDAVAELALRVAPTPAGGVLLYNPLPWPRLAYGPVPAACVQGQLVNPGDASASRHTQDQGQGGVWTLAPTPVPALGYTVVPKAKLTAPPATPPRHSEGGVIETDHLRLSFDLQRGGLLSWYDHTLQTELVDRSSPWPFAGVVHEAVADREGWARGRLNGPIHWDFELHGRAWQKEWRAARGTHVRLLSHKVWRGAVETVVEQTVEVAGLAAPATLRFTVPHHTGRVEIQAQWNMGLVQHPEATYLALPFALPGAVAHLDLGGLAIQPGVDQIPGCCRDYFTVQQWVDFSAARHGVTVACPENPLVQLGDFHFGHDQREFHLERALFLGWVTTNYWETNFRGYQPGRVTARYVIQPHAGPFDEATAHRVGAEATSPLLPQALWETPRPAAALPPTATLLRLPEAPVQVLHLLPAATQRPGDGALQLRLLNASDTPALATVGSGVLRLARVQRTDLFGAPGEEIAVADGAATIALPPRALAYLRLEVAGG